MMNRCRVCGIHIENGHKFYCSEACRQRKKRMKTRKECLYCGGEFLTFRKNSQKYCSRQCMKRQMGRRNASANPLMPYVRIGISCKGAKV